MRIEDATFVVVDTETTGVQAGEDRLVEIGAVKVRGGAIVGTFQHLIDPQRHVPSRITYLTGISTAMVFGQPTAAEVLPSFLDFLGDGILVAHNLQFDYRFLQHELDRAGLPPLDVEALCTLRLARRLLPGLPSRGLDALQAHFGITNGARHRALGDAEATAHVLLRLVERLRTGFGLSTVDDLVAFQRKRYKDATGEPPHVRRLREETLPLLPDRPGVYFFKRKNGEVLYVGKAKSLRSRVRSYFTAIDAHPERLRKLLRDVRVLEWEETGTELGALLRESRLIKTLLPRYNRAQRRYKHYPFLRLDTSHGYPDLSWVPVLRADGAEYYGPLGRRHQAEEIVELVNRLFGLRECDTSTWQAARKARQPCLYGQMDRCLAPCAGDKDTAYAAEVERLRRFLTGADAEVLGTVEAAMREAAAGLDFEQAAWYRDQLRRLEGTVSRQRPFASAVHDLHGVLVEPGADGAAHLFVLRFGRLVERFALPAPPSEADVAALHARLAAHFDEALGVPETFLKSEIDEIRIVAQWVRQHEGSARQVRWQPGTPVADVVAGVLRAARAAEPTAAPEVA